MIQLKRGDEPRWLIENRQEKTEEYRNAPAGSKPSPWRNPKVVQALRRDSYAKCMYCEGFIEDVSYPAVDHIAPKVHFPESVLQWTNLGYCCTVCNTKKSDYWSDHPDLRLLDPYIDAIDEHLHFTGPMVTAKLRSTRASNTLARLKLNEREPLVLSKMRAIEALHTRIRQWDVETDQGMKEFLAEEVVRAIDPTREYAGTLIAYARSIGFPA